MPPDTLIIRLSWATIISEYRRATEEGAFHFGKVRARPDRRLSSLK